MVRQLHLPIDVNDASWEFSFSELMKCKVRNLDIDFIHRPSKLRIKLKSTVRCNRSGDQVAIHLEPQVQVGSYPHFGGKIDISAQAPQQRGLWTLPELKNLSATADIHNTQNFEWKTETFDVKTKSIFFHLQSTSSSDLIVGINIKTDPIEFSSGNVAINLQKLELQNESLIRQMKLSKDSPAESTTQVIFSGIQAFIDDAIVEEDQFALDLKTLFDGKVLPVFDLKINSPFEFRGKGSLTEEKLQTDFNFNFDLHRFFEKRFFIWFQNKFSAFRNSKLIGNLKIKGAFSDKFKDKALTLKANVDLNGKKMELYKIGVFLNDLKLSSPVEFAKTRDTKMEVSKEHQGAISFSTGRYKRFHLKKATASFILKKDRISVSIGDLSQEIFGDKVALKNTSGDYLFTGKDRLTNLNASIYGGPFRVERVLKDLCLLQSHPIEGWIRFTYPRIEKTKTGFLMIGDTHIGIFRGWLHLGDFHYEPPKKRYRFNMEWDEFDLYQIGHWAHFGDMRGTLAGNFRDVILVIDDGKFLPSEYDFRFQLKPRGGAPIRFYGRSIKNILELMGTRREDLPWIADWAIKTVTTWRNLMPVTAEYGGFQAKTIGGFTELRTFDPPGSKNHYFINAGSAFNIPLNAHDVYPVIMHTQAFQDWLMGMVKYFRSSFNKREQEEKVYVEEEKKPEPPKQDQKTKKEPNHAGNKQQPKLQAQPQPEPQPEPQAKPGECVPIF